MPQPITVNYYIVGQFPADDFAVWIVRHATKLSLSGWVRTHSNKLIEIVVTGDPILIDALEVSCSLGPIDAHVDSIEKQAVYSTQMHSRQSAQFIRY